METKKKSEMVLLQEGFLMNLLSGFLGYSLGKDTAKHELTRSFGDVKAEKEATAKQMKSDAELKKLLTKFSATSAELFQYVKRNRKKGGVYEDLYNKLSSFY